MPRLPNPGDEPNSASQVSTPKLQDPEPGDWRIASCLGQGRLFGDIVDALNLFERVGRGTRDMDMWYDHDSDLDPFGRIRASKDRSNGSTADATASHE
jgi:hypothetical protein